MPRCFVAIPLPEDLKDALVALQGGPGVTWAGRDTLHLTVKFFGDVDEADLPALVEALRPCAAETPRLPLALTGFDTFPKRPPAKTLWVAVRGDLANLFGLHAAVDLAAEAFGVERDRRGYLPHVTLGRSPGAPDALVERLRRTRDVGTFHADTLVVYRSELHSDGAVHHPLATLPLGGQIDA